MTIEATITASDPNEHIKVHVGASHQGGSAITAERCVPNLTCPGCGNADDLVSLSAGNSPNRIIWCPCGAVIIINPAKVYSNTMAIQVYSF